MTAADFDVNLNPYLWRVNDDIRSRVGDRVIALNLRNTGQSTLSTIPANKQIYRLILLMTKRRVSNLFFIISPVMWCVDGNQNQFKVMDGRKLLAHLFGRYRPGAQTDVKRGTTDEITTPRGETDLAKELLRHGIPSNWSHAHLFEEFINQMAELMRLEDALSSWRSRKPRWIPTEEQEIWRRVYDTKAEKQDGMRAAEYRDVTTFKKICVNLPTSLYQEMKCEHTDSSGKHFISNTKRQAENRFHVLQQLMGHPSWNTEDDKRVSFKRD